MVFNNYKCNNHHNFNIYINGDKLDLVNKIKFLGVIIDSKLTWHEHIHYLSSHVAKGVGIIGRLKGIFQWLFIRIICERQKYSSSCPSNPVAILFS
ncbi:hypothetical protein HOLleu_07103 [Holothuria leucospilota]|uniref:Uncharacterized protein n=1 Tax=Holothuria leucospilota TaxID=206669 RepID=A0A9Q1CFG8_HOLLE|nr:hypothetical protein HOLleu_07103 [Holothuria leucospilota]